MSWEGTYRYLMPGMAWKELAELVLEAARTPLGLKDSDGQGTHPDKGSESWRK